MLAEQAIAVAVVLFVLLAVHCCPNSSVEVPVAGCGGSSVRLEEGFIVADAAAENQVR